MNTILIFIWVWLAAIATSFWESSVEGRKAWGKGKIGWKIRVGKKIAMTKYHFFLILMFTFIGSLPLIIVGPNLKLFGILISAAFTGGIIEDFMWYVVNPKVKVREFWTSFSDYFDWIKINGKKIIPVIYLMNLLIAFLSWYFLWR